MNRHFARHYLEMLLAMGVGMVVLGGLDSALLSAMGSSTARVEKDAPALMLLAMGFNMTVPMVAWMRVRGHGWGPSAEMAASMILPSLAVVAFLAAGVVTDLGALLGIQHVVMLPAMLVAMVLRKDEYSHPHRSHAALASRA
jgi:hypothetical protein